MKKTLQRGVDYGEYFDTVCFAGDRATLTPRAVSSVVAEDVWAILATVVLAFLALAFVAEFAGRWLGCLFIVVARGPIGAIATEMPSILAFSPSVLCHIVHLPSFCFGI